MLYRASNLENYRVRGTDGEIGHVTDLLFDDNAWTCRYMVVKTGSFMTRREVLISPIAINQPKWESETIDIRLNSLEVGNSPPLSADELINSVRLQLV